MAHNSDRRVAAEASRDTDLLAELHAAKRKHNPYFRLFSAISAEDSIPDKLVAAAPMLDGVLNPEIVKRQEETQDPLPLLKIPDFPSRMK